MKREEYKKLPEEPGVYIMKDKEKNILYVGKAGNLRRRVSSYFERGHDSRIEKLVEKIVYIDFIQTDSAMEALILEARLIKQHEPPFNIREKDDKSFLYIAITKEKFPRVLLIRGKDTKKEYTLYGPFTQSGSLKEALRIIQKIFPWNVHDLKNSSAKPCFNYSIGLCPGTCVRAISKKEYAKTIRHIKLFFEGKKSFLIKRLEKEMKIKSQALKFEEAEKIKRQIFALSHIMDVATISNSEIKNPYEKEGTKKRIEGYDISNISGNWAVGSMVVFEGNNPNKNEYRKFKIQSLHTPNDIEMIREIISRRFKNNWKLPDLILIDGGKGQIHAAKNAMKEAGYNIPIIGIVKGPERKRNDIIGKIPSWTFLKTLTHVRDEAHRFAISYHKSLRAKSMKNPS